MAITTSSSGTTAQTAGGGEVDIATINVIGKYRLKLDLDLMAAGDVVYISKYLICKTGGASNLAGITMFSGVDGTLPGGAKVVTFDEDWNDLAETDALQYTINQPFGTTRALPFAVIKDDANAAVATDVTAIKTKTDFLPSVVAGGAGGVFIAGTNAATTVTTALTTTFTGNLTGSVASVTGAVGSVTGAVGSVTGAVGSVTGAVGSVTGNVGGNVVGSVASVTAKVTPIDVDGLTHESAMEALLAVLLGVAAPSGATVAFKKQNGITTKVTVTYGATDGERTGSTVI